MKITLEKFINATQRDKRRLIDSAIKGDEKYYFTRNCLIAMIENQRKEAKEAYDAFVYDNLSQADFKEY